MTSCHRGVPGGPAVKKTKNKKNPKNSSCCNRPSLHVISPVSRHLLASSFAERQVMFKRDDGTEGTLKKKGKYGRSRKKSPNQKCELHGKIYLKVCQHCPPTPGCWGVEGRHLHLREELLPSFCRPLRYGCIV